MTLGQREPIGDTGALTDATGKYTLTIADRGGVYRALVRRSTVGGHTCLAASSAPVTHRS